MARPEGKVLEYTLIGDPYDPKGGTWSPRTNGRFGRPFMVWYPDPGRRNIDRQLTSPGLEYGLIRQITRGPAAKPLFDPRIPPLLPSLGPVDDEAPGEDAPVDGPGEEDSPPPVTRPPGRPR